MRDPGIYYDVPAAEYHADAAISHSGLKHFARSPAHYQEYKRHPPEPTAAMIFGSAYDCLVTEGDAVFNDRYSYELEKPAGMDLRRTKDASVKAFLERRKMHEADAEGKTILPRTDFFTMIAMAAALQWDDKARALLSDATQVSIWWDDPETGVRCRGRLDAWHRATRSVIDLKTTKDASAQWFPRDAHGRGYHNQLAMYAWGMRYNGEDIQHSVLVAQEKEPPYAIAKWELSDQSQAAGYQWFHHHIRNYARCLETDKWPGYPEEIQMMEAPPWI